MGIKIVVDVRGTKRDAEGKKVRKLGMEYVSSPWHCPFPRDEVRARFLKLLRDDPGKKVFVHCRLGDYRDGMMIASLPHGDRCMVSGRSDEGDADIWIYNKTARLRRSPSTLQSRRNLPTLSCRL